MPAIAELLAKRAGLALEGFGEATARLERDLVDSALGLEKRIYTPCCNSSSPPGLVEANTVDPWSDSGKYALGWVYFCVIVLVFATLLRVYNFFTDKIRIALHNEELLEKGNTASPDVDYELSALSTDKSTAKFFPREGVPPSKPSLAAPGHSNRPLDILLASCRFIFYRPIPNITYRRGWRPISFPSLGVLVLVGAALAFTVLYCFVPQPLYWQSIQFGSPPLAIRSGMIAVAMMPWIVATSMKANLVSVLTGIGHERLNVLHRWLAYICLLLSLIHTIPFYVQPVWDQGGLAVFNSLFPNSSSTYIYGTGIAALVPLIVLCIHSLAPLRRRFYELFLIVHVPVSILLLAMLFWHCANYLTSWAYLWSTMAVWLASYAMRLFYLNWTNPFRMSWLVGEEAAVTVLPEDAVKVTIPTQVKWRPGQYVYLRMPGVSIFENHPFTIASLCNEDFPSGYGEEYKDMVLVFRPFGGFTKKVLDSALDHGPWHTYRAFIDGPYGGVRRAMHSFDHVVLIAGGSGITALVSHLLDLVKRMRDGRAVTKEVHIVWALKRPEIMEWFKEELRICREYAPPDTVHCQFFVTAAKRQSGKLVSAHTPTRPVSALLHNKVNDMFQNVASNRYSTASSHRYSALIREEAGGDVQREEELRAETEDRIRPLPEAHVKPVRTPSQRHAPPAPSSLSDRLNAELPLRPPEAPSTRSTPHLPPHPTLHEKRRAHALTLDTDAAHHSAETTAAGLAKGEQQADFGFPATPTEFQKSLMRFAFMPAAVRGGAKKSGWSTEWGRPALPHMLREMADGWAGRRACVFVCGPPGMRVEVGNTAAELQRRVLAGSMDEVFLHAENYAL